MSDADLLEAAEPVLFKKTFSELASILRGRWGQVHFSVEVGGETFAAEVQIKKIREGIGALCDLTGPRGTGTSQYYLVTPDDKWLRNVEIAF
jgi:hypothetical protein